MRLSFPTITYGCALVMLGSCGNERSTALAPPALLNDGWQVATAAEAELDSALLARACDICRQNGKVDAFLVARNGRLVIDEYYNGFEAGTLHKVWSVTKSVTSVVTGIALDKGLLHAVDDSIASYLELGSHPDKASITLKNTLSMTTGIDWVELGGPASAGYRMAFAADWVDFVLALPMRHAPGTTFNYSTGNYVLLAPILKNATGIQADDFARQHLFSPLGISNYSWARCAEFWTKTESGELPSAQKPTPPIQYDSSFSAFPNTGSGLSMLPRDMAKIGQLFLNGGRWNNTQVVSNSWVKESVTPCPEGNYGYGWRSGTLKRNDVAKEAFYAHGFGGQCIYVIPSAHVVVVITQHNYRAMDDAEKVIQSVLEGCILPAIQH